MLLLAGEPAGQFRPHASNTVEDRELPNGLLVLARDLQGQADASLRIRHLAELAATLENAVLDRPDGHRERVTVEGEIHLVRGLDAYCLAAGQGDQLAGVDVDGYRAGGRGLSRGSRNHVGLRVASKGDDIAYDQGARASGRRGSRQDRSRSDGLGGRSLGA